MRGKGGKEERPQKAWKRSAIIEAGRKVKMCLRGEVHIILLVQIPPEEKFDTTSELTLFQVTGCCEARGYRAATQMKGLCTEITTVPVADIVAKRRWL